VTCASLGFLYVAYQAPSLGPGYGATNLGERNVLPQGSASPPSQGESANSDAGPSVRQDLRDMPEAQVFRKEIPVSDARNFGVFVDPADASTWRKTDGQKVVYGQFVDPEDRSTWFVAEGVASYGEFVDPQAAPRRLNLDGHVRDYGTLVDPADPYTWREGSGAPSQYGDEYINPAP
jgi:hypothetical protein